MHPHVKGLILRAVALFVAAGIIVVPRNFITADGNPHGAYYSADTNRVLWFIHVSDTHIGAKGTADSDRLRWLVTTGKAVINPSFIVATGDLTDSTNGNIFGLPNGPYQAEWDEYKGIVDPNVGANFYFDIPGNHDAYNDATFAYYRANSVQGRATNSAQVAWTRTLPTGETYRFLGVNTAGNTGAPFSISFPYGDPAGLDSGELAFVDQELAKPASLALVFGHHPVTDTGVSGDTWLFYGHQDFVQRLDLHSASAYSYGHTHAYSQALFRGNDYTGYMAGDGIAYNNIASLAKSSSNNYSVVAIDSNGVSAVPATAGTWPVVLITAPVDAYLGTERNPYAYTVPPASDNPIRALVFDAAANPQVTYRIDAGSIWYPMTRVADGPLWQATWNASALAAGDHTIEVRAVGTSTRSDTVTATVTGVTPIEVLSLEADSLFPAPVGTPVTWRVTATGGTAPLEYVFWLSGPGPSWVVIQPYSPSHTLLWTPSATGTYRVQVGVRSSGSTTAYDAVSSVVVFSITGSSPLVVTDLSANVVLPAPVGSAMTWTATATGGTAPLEYAFWLSGPGPGWTVIQPYSTSHTLLWTPSATGTYRIQVGVRNSGSTAAYDAVSNVVLFSIAASPPVVTGLSANVTLPAPLGSPMTWTATAIGGTAPLQYAFWLSGPGPGWVVIQPYSPSNTLLWTPSATGTYRIQVGVRSIGSAAPYDAVSSVVLFSIAASPPVVTDLSANVTLPAPVGSPMTWTATATGGTAPLQYAFWLSGPGPGWVVIQPYSTANTLLWTPNAPGTYRIQVGVRNSGSTAAYDAVSSVVLFSVTASAPVVTDLSASVTLVAPAGSPMTWTATDGSAALQYRF
jgi:hypothetical protein